MNTRSVSIRGEISALAIIGLLALAVIAVGAILVAGGVVQIPGKSTQPQDTPQPVTPARQPNRSTVIVQVDLGAYVFSENSHGRVILYHGSAKTMDGRSQVTFEVSPGKYMIHACLQNRLASQEIVAVAGKPNDVRIDLRKVDNLLVFIPAGEYEIGHVRGQDGEQVDGNSKRVHLDAFYIERFEVTNLRYRLFVAYVRSTNDYALRSPLEPRNLSRVQALVEEIKAHDGSGGMFNENNQPAVAVDWYGAYHYARWAGLRLPTEAEWEKAASWDPVKQVKTVYPWGDDFDKKLANTSNPDGRTKPVDSYKEGKSYYGCFNMVGNAAEWVDDWYVQDYYKLMADRNPQPPPFVSAEQASSTGQPETRLKVTRGGSGQFMKTGKQFRYTTYARSPVDPLLRNINLGFRCARSATPEEIVREEAKLRDKSTEPAGQ